MGRWASGGPWPPSAPPLPLALAALSAALALATLSGGPTSDVQHAVVTRVHRLPLLRPSVAQPFYRSKTTASFSSSTPSRPSQQTWLPAWAGDDPPSESRTAWSLACAVPAFILAAVVAIRVSQLPRLQWREYVMAATAEAESGTAEWRALHAWMAAKGGDCASRVADGQFRFAEGGPAVRGIGAPHGAQPRQVLLSLPRTLALVAPTNAGGLPDTMALAAVLATERRKGDTGDWAPYLATLPAEVRTPYLMVAEGSVKPEDLQYEPARRAVADLLAEAQQGFGWLPANSGVGWLEYLRAVSLVHSRTFRMKGLKLMLPGIDMLNHGGDMKNCGLGMTTPVWDSDPSGGIIQVIATREIRPGEQVLWNYGDRCNDDFFLYYGFLLPGNPCDVAELFPSLEAAREWHAQEFPHANPTSVASEPENLGQGQVGYNGADFSVLTCLADRGREARHLASFRLHRVEWGTHRERDTVPELLVRRSGLVDRRLVELFEVLGGPPPRQCLARRAQQLLAAFPTTADEDSRLLAGPLPDDLALLVEYRRNKKRVLHDVCRLWAAAGD